MAKSVSAIVMAAGKGTRLKSKTPKVLHQLFGQPLLGWVLESLQSLSQSIKIRNTWVIVGHEREQVNRGLECMALSYPDIHLQTSVVQEPQLGTGHAVQQVKNAVSKISGPVLILSGDVPLLRTESLQSLIEQFDKSESDLTLMAAHLDSPAGYGRVLVDPESQQVQKIVEEKDASPVEKLVTLVNTGIYCIRWETIAPLLDKLSSNNAQGEFYLTDVIAHAVENGLKVTWTQLDDPLEMCGINQRLDLSICHEVLHQRAVANLMQQGVTFLHPGSTLISPKAKIAPDTVVYPGCVIDSDVVVGENCEIGPHTTLKGKIRIGDNCQVVQSYMSNTTVEDHCYIGPFAHLRDQSIISHHVRVGNFVEVKNATIGHHSAAAHLAYLGDVTLGVDVNIGAGTIVANFDPIRDLKHRSTLEDGSKIGCNSVIVSPVTVSERACVAAGSVITQDVESWDLAIARGRQSVIPGWVKKIKESMVSAK